MESGRRFKNELLEQFHEMCESLRYYRSDQIGFFGIQRMNLGECSYQLDSMCVLFLA